MAVTPGSFGGATVEVEGLRELVRAFQRMSKDLADDLVMELQEAADPARKLTEQYITGGGGGFPAMTNVPLTRAYEASRVRVGVSKGQGLVYLAPDWRSKRIRQSNPMFGLNIRWRMEAAVEDSADKIEKNLGDWLDTLADSWGYQYAA